METQELRWCVTIPFPNYKVNCTFNPFRFHFASKISNTLRIDHAWSYNRNYLFNYSKSYFAIAVDEKGLWVTYSSSLDDNIMVAQLEAEAFSVLRHINTTYPPSKAGNTVIICGVLYVMDVKHTHVTFAFDLLREKQVDAKFELKQSEADLAMLSYSPRDKHLSTWEAGYLRKYAVHFSS